MAAPATAHRLRDGSSSQIEEDPCIRPLLETRKSGHREGTGTQYLPDAKDGHEVWRVPEQNDAFHGLRNAHQLRCAATQTYEYDHGGRRPVRHALPGHE